MTREEEIRQAAYKYIESDAVRPENEQLAFGDFINGIKWADEHPLNSWISVDERLPEEIEVEKYKNTKNEMYEISKDVFVIDKCGNKGVGCYDYTRKFWLLPYYFRSDAEIVQWMPIPELKKGE